VGYAGGVTANPGYEEVCSGRTGHTEVVRVVFDPRRISYAELLRVFWEAHDPTQGMRQGNDVGTQYRSAIYTYGDEQAAAAAASRDAYQQALAGKCTKVFVSGPSGVGKSTLVREFLAGLPPEVAVLEGRCYAQEFVPYKACDSAIRSGIFAIGITTAMVMPMAAPIRTPAMIQS